MCFILFWASPLCACDTGEEEPGSDEDDLYVYDGYNSARISINGKKIEYLLSMLSEEPQCVTYARFNNDGSLHSEITLYLPQNAEAGRIYSFDDPAGEFAGSAGVTFYIAETGKTYYALYDPEASPEDSAAFAIAVDDVTDGVLCGRFAADFNHSDGETDDPFAIAESRFSVDLLNRP